MLFETSWEVCNKVGGIYTVLSTKAAELRRLYGDRVVFVGPDMSDGAEPQPGFIPAKSLLKYASSRLKLPWGITVRIGRWDIPGSPLVALVSFKGVYAHLDEIFGKMWSLYGVDSLHEYGDYREACAFAVAAAKAIEGIIGHMRIDARKVIAHFDEWTTGMGLLTLRHQMPDVATVFTTHATSIGRSICGNGKPLYDYFDGYNGDQMASELNMEAKHSLEKHTAAEADCFTTVSEVTARECRQLLGVSPKVVTPNGFEPDFVPGTAKAARLRADGRKRLLHIASLLTGRQWTDDTFIVATSGRNEYRNKGIDLFLDAIDRIRSGAPAKDILALVLVPAWVREPSGALLLDLENNVADSDLASDAYIKPQPDWLTHRLNNEDSDAIACRLRGMEERPGQPGVKAIFVPCYLDGHDGIVDISYYDLLPALDLTVFPSYYEPWGYTPLESIAFGVPTVSSDKAGFGQWVLDEFGPSQSTGVSVISRTDSNYDSDVAQVASIIEQRASMPAKDAQALRKAAAATAKRADWKFFITRYETAYADALAARDARVNNLLTQK